MYRFRTYDLNTACSTGGDLLLAIKLRLCLFAFVSCAVPSASNAWNSRLVPHGPAQRMLDHAAVMLLTAAAAWKFCDHFYLKQRGKRIEKNPGASATWER